MPSTDSESCHITSGCSGLPKLRQLTNAFAVAPTQARFETLSATVSSVPLRGSSAHQRGFESVESAMPRFDAGRPGPARRSSAASLPGPTTVFKKSCESY